MSESTKFKDMYLVQLLKLRLAEQSRRLPGRLPGRTPRTPLPPASISIITSTVEEVLHQEQQALDKLCSLLSLIEQSGRTEHISTINTILKDWLEVPPSESLQKLEDLEGTLDGGH